MRVPRRRPASWLALLLSTLFLLVPAAASADVRSGSAQDPQDSTPSLSGPRAPDVQAVQASYDPNGSFSIAVTLYEPWNQTTQAYQTFRAAISDVTPLSATATGSCGDSFKGRITVTGNVNPPNDAGYFEVGGFTGTLPLTRTISADGRTTTFSGATPLLAGYDLGCVRDVELYHPDPYGHCFPSEYNCQTVYYSYGGDEAPNFYFAGHAPAVTQCSDGIDNDGDHTLDRYDYNCAGYDSPSEFGPGPGLGYTLGPGDPPEPSEPSRPVSPKTACSDGKDNDGDGKTDRKDPGCLDIALGTTEVDPRPVASRSRVRLRASNRTCSLEARLEVFPELLPRRLFPMNRATLSVKGVSGWAKGYSANRKVGLAPTGRRTFRWLAPGRYRVSVSYPGDRWRRASKATTRTVRVC